GDTVKSLRSRAFGATTAGCSAHAENPSASAGRNVRFVYFMLHLRTGLASTWCYKPQKQRPAKRSVLVTPWPAPAALPPASPSPTCPARSSPTDPGAPDRPL